MVWRCERQKINKGLLLQPQGSFSLGVKKQHSARSTQLGCQEAGHSCYFFIRSRISGLGSSSLKALYLKQLLDDLGIQQERPIAIGEDNQSCIRLCQNAVMHKRSKHIETKFHFIWDKTEHFGLFQFITFLQTKWQRTSSQSPYRSKSGNIQSSLDGNRLYAISSSLSGYVRIMI